MKTALLSALLGLALFISGVPDGCAAEVAKASAASPLPTQAEAIEALSSLADPAKLATVGERGANPRMHKIIYWLAVVRQNGGKLDVALDTAFATFGWKGTLKGEETKLTLLRNFARAENLGCFNPEGLAGMRRGNAPIIRRGEWFGDKINIDHVLPRAKVPELDNVLANLEYMPSRMNAEKSDKIGDREITMARRFVAAGLIAPELVPWAAPFPGQNTVAAPVPPRADAPPAAKPATPVVASAPSSSYVASRKSDTFHQSDCKSVAKISASNLVKYATREEAIAAGKNPCASCKP
jgi:hypothetical protein